MACGLSLADVAVFLAALVASAMGIYGAITARNVIRLLVSIEIIFNSVLLEVAYIGFLSGLSVGFYSLLVTVIALTIAEIAIVIALTVLAFRKKQSLDMESMTEARG
ncbi:NADH-quinone oxidoreductase subunit NuoK [Hyperthermus butylicus]|uniref:NADH-quinone oxidoreductase subunit NuoK n=1 Tax=Hyperthermus butylicus TaxID=54248 RepID=UPI000323EA35|nr:NADH-quinone oxidoreductase subunit K [Hyperthermus butylicus]